MSSIHFYIIYLPGTVNYLLPLVSSLLSWSDSSYSLVANGCTTIEQNILSGFCKNHSQLSYLTLPFNKIVSHGVALNYLQTKNIHPTFGFMDSDIFATGPFQSPLMEALKSNIGVFSGSPLWCKPEEGILKKTDSRIFGRHHKTLDSRCLGSTYFALYQHKKLVKHLTTSELDFRTKEWRQLFDYQQLVIKNEQLKKSFYDTGKLINITLLNKGKKLIFLDLPNLVHLGGFSRYSKNQSKNLPEKVKLILQKVKQKKFQSILTKLPYWIDTEWFLPNQIAFQKSKLLRQVLVEKYISQLLIGLVDNTTLPSWKPSKDAAFDLKMSLVTQSLKELYKNSKK